MFRSFVGHRPDIEMIEPVDDEFDEEDGVYLYDDDNDDFDNDQD